MANSQESRRALLRTEDNATTVSLSGSSTGNYTLIALVWADALLDSVVHTSRSSGRTSAFKSQEQLVLGVLVLLPVKALKSLKSHEEGSKRNIPITDILLRTLLKSRIASSLYIFVSPISTTVMVSGVRARNTNPKFLAAVTRAPSSGDWAWYTKLPDM